MIVAFQRPCATHRAALLDFIDRRERGASTDAALAHLDRCPACVAELSEVGLAIAALRRLHHELQAVEPPGDAWPRLRARIRRADPAPWRWRTSLGGLATGAMLVALFVAPIPVRGPGATAAAAPRSPAAIREEYRAEADYLIAVRKTSPGPNWFWDWSGGSVPPVYPDGIRPVKKEVDPEKPSGRPPEAI